MTAYFSICSAPSSLIWARHGRVEGMQAVNPFPIHSVTTPFVPTVIPWLCRQPFRGITESKQHRRCSEVTVFDIVCAYMPAQSYFFQAPRRFLVVLVEMKVVGRT